MKHDPNTLAGAKNDDNESLFRTMDSLHSLFDPPNINAFDTSPEEIFSSRPVSLIKQQIVISPSLIRSDKDRSRRSKLSRSLPIEARYKQRCASFLVFLGVIVVISLVLMSIVRIKNEEGNEESNTSDRVPVPEPSTIQPTTPIPSTVRPTTAQPTTLQPTPAQQTTLQPTTSQPITTPTNSPTVNVTPKVFDFIDFFDQDQMDVICEEGIKFGGCIGGKSVFCKVLSLTSFLRDNKCDEPDERCPCSEGVLFSTNQENLCIEQTQSVEDACGAPLEEIKIFDDKISLDRDSKLSRLEEVCRNPLAENTVFACLFQNVLMTCEDTKLKIFDMRKFPEKNIFPLERDSCTFD